MVLLFLLLFWVRSSVAQEMLGVRNSNYAGIQSVFLNPSSIAGSRLPWDAEIAAGLMLDNNFFYIPARQASPVQFGKIAGQLRNRTIQTRYDPRYPDQTYNLSAAAIAMGPSFFAPLNSNTFIGFTMAVRGYADFRNVSGHLAQNLYTNFNDQSLWNKPWHDQYEKAFSASWIEYGLHYAKKISGRKNHKWLIGGGLSLLGGMLSAYADQADLNYMIRDSSHIVVESSALRFAKTKIATEHISPSNLNHGSGLSANMGISYSFGGRYSCNFRTANDYEDASDLPYVFKIGLSVVDWGFLRFSRNSTAYQLDPNSPFFHSDSTGTVSNTGSVSSFLRQLDSASGLAQNHFTLALPSALSLQADWNLFGNYYLNATIIKSLPHGSQPGMTRPDVYSLALRYESAWLEACVPFSLIYYGRWQPRLGLAFRIGYFFFGADAPGSLLGLNNFERTDIYAGIRYFPLPKRHKSDLRCPEIPL